MRFLYIGAIQLPKRDAASIRVANIGYAIKKGGHSVDYLCLESFGSEPVLWEDSVYHYVFSKETIGMEKMQELLFGSRTLVRLKELCREQRYDGVILYNTTSFIESKIIRYCRSEHIRVFGDVTEWYEARTPKGKKDLFPYVNALSVDRRIRKLDQKLDGVIAISRYLYDYYSKQGVSLIRIPPIFHYDRHYLDTDGECKTILYAGSPAVGKDEIGILIDALKAVNRENVMLKLVFVGVNKPEDADALEKYGITFRPRCDTDQVIEYVRASDFTVLFRREKRFAKAGYSTKVAESLFNGVPVLCNEIGGTDTDIENGKNGIKIKGLSMEDVYEGLLQIARLNREESAEIRRNCRMIGDRLFNADHYVEQIDAFLRKDS